jgi:hypothetical protein
VPEQAITMETLNEKLQRLEKSLSRVCSKNKTCRGACFNCGKEGHMVKHCQMPIDQNHVERNKKARGQQVNPLKVITTKTEPKLQGNLQAPAQNQPLGQGQQPGLFAESAAQAPSSTTGQAQ